MHAIEELVIPPYLFGEPVAYTLCLADGTSMKKKYIRHGFQNYVQRYDRLLGVLNSQDYTFGKVLEAETLVISSIPMWEKAEKQLSRNPMFFVDKVDA